ncbi:MAG: UvrD-helicase domain-containing protein [Fusobacteriaceae bacterium]
MQKGVEKIVKTVLKASAGTGKTYRLSLEYLGALLRGESYKNILVMTFTKKATGEIEERIVDFLRVLAGKIRNEDEEKERKALLESLENLYPHENFETDRFKEFYEEICRNRDRLRIYTIDGFINRIFRSVVAPFLGMENYSLIDSDEENEITGRLLEKIFGDKKSFSIFKSFLGNNMEKNLDSYLSLLQSLLQERWRYILVKEKYSGNIPEKESLPYPGDASTPLQVADSIIKNMNEIALIKKKPLEDFFPKDFTEYGKLKNPEDKINYLEKNQDLFIAKNLWNGVKTRGKDCEEILGEMKEKTEKLREKIRIDIYNSRIIKYEREVLGFIDELYRNYDEIKLREGKLTFSDISTYTYMNYQDERVGLIKDGKVTDYFQELFDGEIKTLFIDEFQDTSILQWKLLKAISSSAGRVFCVGDEKQSLYSWRGGEKELFEKLPEILPGREDNLDTSYRSRKNIVNFTNELFGKISGIYETENGGEWKFIPVNFVKDEESYIETVYSDEGEEKNHLDKICQILQERMDGDYRGIAVIARTGKELVEMGNRLSNLHIPFTLKSNKNIFQHRANRGVYRFLKYLAYKDYFSLMEFFRDDGVGISNSDLKELFKKRADIENYLAGKEENLENISELLMKILRRVRETRKNYEKQGGESRYVIPEIFKNFSPLDKFGSSSDIENYYGFMELCRGFKRVENLVKTAENNPSSSLFSQISVEDENAVTLITIHGSKGLEYDTVFFIHNSKGDRGDRGLDFQIKLDENYEKLENFIILNEKSRGLILGDTGESFSQYKFLYDLPLKKLQEKINTWYVGLTRAKRNLFIVLGSCKTEDYLVHALKTLPTVTGEFQNKKRDSVEEENQKSSEIVLDLNLSSFSEEEKEKNLQEQKEFLRTSHNRQHRKILGTAIHYYLENIKYLNLEEQEKSKKNTLSKYGGELGVENLKKILESQELQNSLEKNRDIFSEKWDYIHSEFSIKLEEKEKRIDRMMIRKPQGEQRGEILIVDYKTGVWDDIQLMEYEKAVENILLSEKLQNFYKISSRFMSIELPETEEGGETDEF